MENTALNNVETFKEKNKDWIHTLIAMGKEEVITTNSRAFGSPYVFELDDALNLIWNKSLHRGVSRKFELNEQNIYNALFLFVDREHMKEIEFLKICLSYLRNSDSETIDITVINN